MQTTRFTPLNPFCGRSFSGPVTLLAIVMLVLGLWLPAALADEEDEEGSFEVADIYFELNHTDGDLGIHALIDGDEWKYLEIEGPRGRKLLNLIVRGRLRRQGLTEIFFESAEPTFDELAPQRFFRRFPEGEYEIEGITLDGEELESTDFITHLIPAPPTGIFVSDEFVDPEENDCDESPVEVPTSEIVIRWDPVTASHPDLGRSDEAIEVVNYEVVVEQEDLEMVFKTTLPPDQNQVTVPAEFISLGEEFKFEILVREESGNQTAVENCFTIVDAD